MVVLIILLMTVFGFIAVIKYRKNPFRALVVLSCIYLIALCIAQEMDIVFTVYFLFVFMTLFSWKRVSVFFAVYTIYVGIYGIFGMFFQEMMNAASVLLTRYGFLLLGLLLGKKRECIENCNQEKEWRFAINCGTLTEVIAMIYVLINGDMENRLAINHQAVGGSLSIGVIPLIVALYFSNRALWKKYKLAYYLIINIVIVVMSGTRGYMIIAALPLIPLFIDFYADKRRYRLRWILTIALIWMTFGAFIVEFEVVQEYIVNMLRLDESIGYRVYENAFIKNIFRSSPWYNQLFGFGMGGRATNVPGYYGIVHQSAMQRAWMVRALMTETTVHNYWYTVLFKQGLVGLGLCVLVMLNWYKRIRRIRANRGLYYSLVFLFLGIVISLTFRISGTCGVWETMVMLWIVEFMQEKRKYALGLQERESKEVE